MVLAQKKFPTCVYCAHAGQSEGRARAGRARAVNDLAESQ